MAGLSYRILDGAEQIRLEDVVRLLRTSYWAADRPSELIEKSMRNSACYGVYLEAEEKLVGFARVISDFTTAYYLCDVVIDPEFRHRGLGTALLSYIDALPQYAGLRGLLITRDAHSLYRKFGFETLENRAMGKQHI